jgi:hypothetical protein
MTDTTATFWAKVQTGLLDECWLWLGSRDGDGYGLVRIEGSTRRAHRVSWQETNGPIPPGKQILHSCDNPPCVNPNHLRPGTNLQNVQDAVSKGRNTRLHGSANGLAKLTENNARSIRALAGTVTQRALAERFGVSQKAVWLVIHQQGWTHV